jgi:signal transduction histidine kinase
VTGPAAVTVVELRADEDLVLARQRAREIAGLVGLEARDQTRLAAAVSEIARNALRHGGGGRVRFGVESGERGQSLVVTVEDRGPGLPEHAEPASGGLGLAGVHRLVDRCEIESRAGEGTTVTLRRRLPATSPQIDAGACAEIARRLTRLPRLEAIEELRVQNEELLLALEEAETWRRERDQLRAELDETNRGVVALYAELDDHSLRLAQAHEQKSKFISGLGHELRTPLNSISALARLLLEERGGGLDAEQERQIRYVERAAVEMGELVTEVLDLAKAEARRVPVVPSDVAVGALFRSLGALLRPLVPGRGVRLVFARPSGIPTIRTDEGKLRQIIRNLVANALRFTERGSVRVTAELAENGRFVVIRVADTGCGVAPEQQRRIFDEFVQLEGAGRGGTGLGLPLSRSLAALLGGHLWLDRSEPGRGSVFAVSIPVELPPDVAASVGEGAPPALEGVRILVIEDDEATRYVVRTRLEERGAVVLEEGEGGPGAARALAERPDLVVLDLILPDISGAETLERLRADRSTRSTPVVVYSSADLEPSERVRLERHGAAVVSKAQALDVLLGAIREGLS